MPGSDPQTGDVYYPYIFKRQLGGGGEPEKDRPCCVALRLRVGSFRGADTFLLALSQSGVPHDGFGVLVPKEVVGRLRRLDVTRDTHMVTSEFNSDTAEHPSFQDREYLGSMPRDFLRPVLGDLVARLRAGAGEVNRTGA